MQADHAKSSLTGLVLAGGLATRMGGVNKALVAYQGRPLIEHALAGLTPQVANLMISSNRDVPTLKRYGHPVIGDAAVQGVATQAGPLLGIYTALLHCPTPYLAVAPCDMPHLGTDWLGHLLSALKAHPASTPPAEPTQPHARCAYVAQQPLLCVLERSQAASLMAFLQSGQRQVQAWLQAEAAIAVDVNLQPYQLAHFNHMADLHAARQDGLGTQADAGMTEAACVSCAVPSAGSVKTCRGRDHHR